MNNICPANQWATDVFWRHCHMNIRMLEAQLGRTFDETIESRLEQMYLRDMLDYATEAGTA